MSDDQLDNDLRDRIKQVFDDYQDDTAEEGWLLLRKKYPEEKKDRAIFWYRVAGVAAFLLLFLNIFLWYRDDSGYKKKIAGIHKIEHRIDSDAMATTRGKTIQRDSSIGGVNGSKPTTISKVITVGTKQSPVAGKSGILAHVDQSSLNKYGLPGFPVDSESKQTPTATFTAANKAPAVVDSVKTNIQTPNSSSIGKKSIMADQQQPVAVSKAMQQLFDKEDKSKKNTEEQQTAANRIALGIYAASYVNYAKGSQRQFNNGAGISSDIRLTDNLSISTGVAIGQNTLAYNSTTPSMPVALMAINSHNFSASTSALPLVVPASKNLNANLVNLDVPVNLKYNFNPQTGNTYVAAGLSSGTFINESYNTTYSYNAPDNGTVLQSQEGSHKSFDNFYFAQMVNLAFGVGYPLGKNHLVIEPFFKYPLNGLGDQHILFGSGGINLKFNFDAGKQRK
ncbi:outer membrane beta-barrel protein [Mucilaginibacter sp. L196]|uniref:outer membrane beta-barrel protein n=1 Tax=Mucilaginibacter sp. L196 TaxID=1641870 RepID=UPI00131DF9D6|nr:outer membrane beta-barrel protein [Mucilaginibacter sp. L196]